jgi:hypothetical protein
VAYVRTVKTSSGATAVQIVWSFRRGSRKIEHIGPAHDDAELEALKAAARQRLAAGQLELGFDMDRPGPSMPLEIASSRMVLSQAAELAISLLEHGWQTVIINRHGCVSAASRDAARAEAVRPAEPSVPARRSGTENTFFSLHLSLRR